MNIKSSSQPPLKYGATHYRHWLPSDHIALEQAGSSLEALAAVAVTILTRLPQRSLHFASAPITTGGVGTIEKNMLVLRRCIEYLVHHWQLDVFSQFPFEAPLRAFYDQWMLTAQPNEYCWPILNVFYKRIFEAQRFGTVHFIHGYESSTGARWEFDQCDTHGITRKFLSQKVSTVLLAFDPLNAAHKDHFALVA